MLRFVSRMEYTNHEDCHQSVHFYLRALQEVRTELQYFLWEKRNPYVDSQSVWPSTSGETAVLDFHTIQCSSSSLQKFVKLAYFLRKAAVAVSRRSVYIRNSHCATFRYSTSGHSAGERL